jgi:hypothetical protein
MKELVFLYTKPCKGIIAEDGQKHKLKKKNGTAQRRERVVLEVGFKGKVLLTLILVHDTSTLVVRDTLLEKVGLALEGDHIHEVEGVADLVVLLTTQGNQKTISNEFNVLAHEDGVHANEGTRQSITQELLFNFNSFHDDHLDTLSARLVAEKREEKTGEVSVQAFITRDKFVGEGQARHQTTLLEPEDGGEGARKEDTLDSSKSNQTFSKGVVAGNPLESPGSLLGNAGN